MKKQPTKKAMRPKRRWDIWEVMDLDSRRETGRGVRGHDEFSIIICSSTQVSPGALSWVVQDTDTFVARRGKRGQEFKNRDNDSGLFTVTRDVVADHMDAHGPS